MFILNFQTHQQTQINLNINSHEKEKEYTLVYLDREGNELTEKRITATSKKEAEKQRKAAFAVCMINDCNKIIIR